MKEENTFEKDHINRTEKRSGFDQRVRLLRKKINQLKRDIIDLVEKLITSIEKELKIESKKANGHRDRSTNKTSSEGEMEERRSKPY